MLELRRILKALPADPKRRVRTALAVRDLTQTRLAKAAGIDPGLFSNVLNGNRELTDAQQAAVAKVLDVPADLLFQKVA